MGWLYMDCIVCLKYILLVLEVNLQNILRVTAIAIISYSSVFYST